MAARRRSVLMALYVFLAEAAAASAPQLTTATPTTRVVPVPGSPPDLTMAPNEFTSVTVLRSQEQSFPPILQSGFVPMTQPLIAARADVRPPPHLFLSQAPPLGHTRSFHPSPPSPVTPKYVAPHPNPRPRPDQVRAPSQRSFDAALLGSGDFGVIRGGTFYPEEEMPYHPEDNSDLGDFYGEASGGHAHAASEGFVERYTYPEEQFEHFRDFADLKTPAEGAFSQFLVVYAAKNSTRPGDPPHPHPKNIFEQLELLDREKALEEEEAKAEKKKSKPHSKAKAKLAKTKLQKRYRKKKPSAKELDYEPLLALS